MSMKNDDSENVLENVSHVDTDSIKESLNESNDNHIWNICENWRGLIGSSNIINEPSQQVSKPKSRTNPSYLDKFPEWYY